MTDILVQAEEDFKRKILQEALDGRFKVTILRMRRDECTKIVEEKDGPTEYGTVGKLHVLLELDEKDG